MMVSQNKPEDSSDEEHVDERLVRRVCVCVCVCVTVRAVRDEGEGGSKS